MEIGRVTVVNFPGTELSLAKCGSFLALTFGHDAYASDEGGNFSFVGNSGVTVTRSLSLLGMSFSSRNVD